MSGNLFFAGKCSNRVMVSIIIIIIIIQHLYSAIVSYAGCRGANGRFSLKVRVYNGLSALEVDNFMRYINLLTYLLTLAQGMTPRSKLDGSLPAVVAQYDRPVCSSSINTLIQFQDKFCSVMKTKYRSTHHRISTGVVC